MINLKVSPFWGILAGLLALFAGFMIYDISGNWGVSIITFLATAGLGLCLVDVISKKLKNKNEGGDSSPIDFQE